MAQDILIGGILTKGLPDNPDADQLYKDAQSGALKHDDDPVKAYLTGVPNQDRPLWDAKAEDVEPFNPSDV